MVNLHTAEKPAVVLDIGTAFTKAGYSGDYSPICIVPTAVQNVAETVWLRDIANETKLRDCFRTLLRNIYLKKLLLSMNERPVVVCESLVAPILWKETLAKVLLIDFDVPHVLFAPRHLLSLYALGIQSGLVVHSGYSDTVVLPVYENMVLLNAWQTLSAGGQAVQTNLDKLLHETACVTVKGKTTPLHESEVKVSADQMEDIKVRTCFVTKMSRARSLRHLSETDANASESTLPNPPKDVSFNLSGSTVLSIPGRVREVAPEVLYEGYDDECTLAHALLNSILQCPIDARKALASNIVLIGGNAMLPGFKARLKEELLDLAKEPNYSGKLILDKFCFHSLPVKENCAAWLGGAILGACGNLESLSLTKAQYESYGGSVPDWSSFTPEITE